MSTNNSQVFSHLTTIAFVGPAGTGKSHRAQVVAARVGAQYIIDDGLIIYKGTIVCGRSAKSENNKVSAIRRAIFDYDDHRIIARNFLHDVPRSTVMIIATSDKMINTIIDRLSLPVPSKYIKIEDVSTPNEIMEAKRERRSKGLHVIPVSRLVVQKNFAGKVLGQLKDIWQFAIDDFGEKSIVKPPFSFNGTLKIEKEALFQLTEHITKTLQQVDSIGNILIETKNSENLIVEVSIVAKIGTLSLRKLAEELKRRVFLSLSYFTGLDVSRVSVVILEVKF